MKHDSNSKQASVRAHTKIMPTVPTIFPENINDSDWSLKSLEDKIDGLEQSVNATKDKVHVAYHKHSASVATLDDSKPHFNNAMSRLQAVISEALKEQYASEKQA